MTRKPFVDLTTAPPGSKPAASYTPETQRTKAERIARLRRRLDRGPLDASALAAVMKGILDLLEDEL
jgi:hypothetical protein